MKRYKVIGRRCLPTSLPITRTLVAYLILDRFRAPGWLWGCVGTYLAFLWIITIVLMVVETQVDLVELKDSR